MTGQTLVAILGPTASGKSALGIALAERHNGEIVSCDSTAVYRGFDIGTDKVSVESAGEYLTISWTSRILVESMPASSTREAAAAVIRDARGRLLILVGGTGFYYRALSRGLFAGRDATRRCARGWPPSRAVAVPSGCTGCSPASIRRPPTASNRGTRSA